MFASIEPPNERTLIITKILKIFCVLTLIVGVFKFSSQPLDTSSLLYFLAGLLYFLSWRALSYYYCLSNAVINVSMIFILLQEVSYLRLRWPSCFKMDTIRLISAQPDSTKWDALSSLSYRYILTSMDTKCSNNSLCKFMNTNKK